MKARLTKMYKNNPILFVHLAAFVVLVTLKPITGIFSVMIGLKIPEKFSIANSSAYFAAVFFSVGTCEFLTDREAQKRRKQADAVFPLDLFPLNVCGICRYYFGHHHYNLLLKLRAIMIIKPLKGFT